MEFLTKGEMMQRQFGDSVGRAAWLLLGVWAMSGAAARGKDPLVFVSAFAAGEKGAIQAYQWNLADGSLKHITRTGGVENPFFLALSPNGRFLYSIHAQKFGGADPEHVAAYELIGRTGELKLLNRQSTHGTAACYLQVDATGQTVVVANYTSGSVAALPVAGDGSLGEAVSFFQHTGSSIDPKRQKEPHAHSMIVSPDNRFALAADLGLDQVLVYGLDAATARLTPHATPFTKTPAGAGPRHVAFHPDGKRLYAINELANSVTVFDYQAATGTLSELQTISTLPSDFSGKSYCADLKITPNGRFLYGTNRGHDSLAAYRIGDDGRLTLLAIKPSRGKGPQNLAIAPGGEWLLCANMPGNNVAVFRIEAGGALKSVGEQVSTPSPSCLQVLP